MLSGKVGVSRSIERYTSGKCMKYRGVVVKVFSANVGVRESVERFRSEKCMKYRG